MLQQYETQQMSEMTDTYVTLRMLYISVVVVAIFITCGLISVLHEQGLNDIEYPYPFYVWNYNGLTNYTPVRKRREARNPFYERNNRTLKHYRLPKDSVLDHLSDLTLSKVFWFYINHIQALCRNVTSMSSTGNGKKICVDDFHISRRHDCLVYSIGSDLSFDFELQVQKAYNCEIHALQVPRFTNEIHTSDSGSAVNVLEGIVVHKMLNKNTFHEGINHNKLSKAIWKQINRANRIIDILKMDVDGEEWNILSMLLNSGLLKHVRQLLVEINFGSGSDGVSKSEDLKVLRHLYEKGFRISIYKHILTPGSISYKPNLTITNINEITFVNTKLKNK